MSDTTRKLLALFVLSLCADLPSSITARTASRLRHLSQLSGADGDADLHAAGESLAVLIESAAAGGGEHELRR